LFEFNWGHPSLRNEEFNDDRELPGAYNITEKSDSSVSQRNNSKVILRELAFEWQEI
jgi:hypothetical protein